MVAPRSHGPSQCLGMTNESHAVMDCPQVDDLCPASAVPSPSSVPRQQQMWPMALAQAGAAGGPAPPAGGEDAKKNLAFMGICHVFLGGRKAFVLGPGCRLLPGRSGRCPMHDLGELCSGLLSTASTSPLSPLVGLN